MNRFRNEYKYLIDSYEKSILQMRMEGLLEQDVHADANGKYIIRSLYFDNIENSCLYENEAGVDPRSKFRIRYYNSDRQYIRLEKKSKRNGMTFKETCDLTTEECELLILGRRVPCNDTDLEIKRKLLLELELRELYPKVIVTYERVPFVYSAGNVRVTFDQAITSSDDIVDFLVGQYRQRPILPCGKSVLEVKWDEFMPLHIKESLGLESLQRTSFSKYYMCRTYGL